MKFTGIVVATVAVMVLAGCGNREEELERNIVVMQSEVDSLNGVIASRDSYFDQIVTSINEVYSNLEDVRQSEEQIRAQADNQEGEIPATSDQARANLMQQVEKVGQTIEENRKKIANLETRVRSLNKEHKGLDEMIASLKQELESRSQTIAMLETNIAGLENEVADKNRAIAEKEAVIETKDTELNTVYYIVGTRSELEELGVINDEGGFLWGLLGSTPVLSSGVDESLFNPLDVSAERSIQVEGEIEEIIPKRKEEYYMSETGENSSNLRILDSERFWQERYLVIVTG